MMPRLALVIFLFSAALSAPLEDLIVDLPGLDHSINFDHYSGYLYGGDENWLHYWFTESQNDPANDPVLLWLNGGPGCSSLEGLLTELGPYFVNEDGSGLYENIYSWNTFANVIFLESPACVGFSYDVNETCKVSDDSTAEQNYNALQDFFTKFPEFRSNEFFITGESYAGVYIPTLSIRVLDGNDTFPINFQGFAIGNGLLSYVSNSNSLYFYGYYHGLLGESLWHEMVDRCCEDGIDSVDKCDFFLNITALCEASVLKAEILLYRGGLNAYNVYDDCLHPEDTNGTTSYEMDIKNLRYLTGRAGPEARKDPPCTDSSNVRAYLNSDETRSALHIPPEVKDWDICDGEVNNKYLRQYYNMHDSLLYLNSRVRGLIYNGDVDMACNVMGNSWDVESLGLTEISGWEKWEDVNGQIGGYAKEFENLIFTTIRGSGHMVPTDKPVQALQMIRAFVLQ